MGRITGIGKDSVRTTLVESSWWLIRKDKAMRAKYEKIKARAGAKRAIVAVARILILRIRRMILDGQGYTFSEACRRVSESMTQRADLLHYRARG